MRITIYEKYVAKVFIHSISPFQLQLLSPLSLERYYENQLGQLGAFQEGSHKLRVMGIRCQGIAASNLYYARAMNKNIKEVRYWKHKVAGIMMRLCR
jgi:hypothetical protein